MMYLSGPNGRLVGAVEYQLEAPGFLFRQLDEVPWTFNEIRLLPVLAAPPRALSCIAGRITDGFFLVLECIPRV